MKTDKKTQVAMADRLKWLNGWLRQRDYDIGDKRKSFIFFYYCALLPLYTPKEARAMTLEVNNRFAAPLDEYAVNSIVRTVNSKRGYMQKNRTIIDTLGITPVEVEALRIGHNLEEQAQRERRRTERNERNKQILDEYMSGYRTSEIADVRPDISSRTIERVLAGAAHQRKQERNAAIIRLAEQGETVAAIAVAYFAVFFFLSSNLTPR